MFLKVYLFQIERWLVKLVMVSWTGRRGGSEISDNGFKVIVIHPHCFKAKRFLTGSQKGMSFEKDGALIRVVPTEV